MRATDLASLAGTTVRAIRYYHQLGLLAVPERGTTWRSYRFAHHTRLLRIRWLVDSGVPLAEIARLLTSAAGTAAGPTAQEADERTAVADDLTDVLTSIDARIATLGEQRARVAALLDRVRTEGRLSPLPPSVVALYAAMLARPLPPELVESMTRERDLVELACYRAPLPPDLLDLVEAARNGHVDEVRDIWLDYHRLAQAARSGLTDPLREQLRQLAARTLDLCARVQPTATGRLLARVSELDRPLVRAAVDLAYPATADRAFLTALISEGRQRSNP
jgi:DNA-binding transcriptional MerR regulator